MRGARSYIASDNFGQPCNCLDCQAAGVTHLQIVKVPKDDVGPARWIHGEELKRWHEARARAREQFNALTQSKAFGGSR